MTKPGESPLLVLIADQHDADLEVLQRLLRAEGHTMRLVRDGQQALAAYEQQQPDLLLINADLPVIDGYEVCRTIRDQIGGVHVPILLFIPIDDEISIQRAFDAGSDDYLGKPFRMGVLRAHLRGLIRKSQEQAALRHYAAELEDANRELEAYAHVIAHDLKSPLGNIKSYLDVLELTLERDPAKAQNIVGRIREVTEHMVVMVRHLLWMARLRHSDEAMQAVDVYSVVQNLMVRFPPNKAQIDVAEDLPPAMGHIPWIEEIFANLIENAIKYMGEGNTTPLIQIRGTMLNNHEQIRYEVQDNGIGIKPEDQERLFAMFSQAQPAQNPRRRNSFGLGLSIVHQIINNLSGHVGVDSEPGQGSTFWFTLPAVTPDITDNTP